MGGWKKGVVAADGEADRLDRQKAAFGAETLSKLKDLNVLIVGLRGVGVEAAKNLILTNVGSVTVWDPEPTSIRDLGSNFYLTEAHAAAGTRRTEACLPQLKSLNPFCKVEEHTAAEGVTDEYLCQPDVSGTGKPFAAVIVTRLLPKAELCRLNETCRGRGIAFMLALTNGVACSIFSDFGPKHTINDADGEPTETFAISNIEVLPKPPILKVDGVEDGAPIVVISFPSNVNNHMEDGTTIELDDFDGDMAVLSGRQFAVKRIGFVSPRKAEVKVDDPSFLLQLSNGIGSCCEGWQKQHDTFQAEHEAASDGAASTSSWRSQTRDINLLSRMVLVPGDAACEEACKRYAAGGLASPVKPTLTKAYRSLAETLGACSPPSGAPGNPQMAEAEAWSQGRGIDVHLALSATLEFQAAEGRWPALGSAADGARLVELAEACSAEHKSSGVDGAVWAQKMEWGFPSGEARAVDAGVVGRFSRFYSAELTGFCAFLGGCVAQEVVKKTGKFTPIEQWIHHEDAALVTDECATNTGPLLGTRYDDQIAVMGKDFQARMADATIFMVGCGALGCEYLKGLALMGAGTSRRGSITVTDMDTIETSNLSRQFLFRNSDVGCSKSVSGARVVKEWNPAMNIKGVEQFVGASTEDVFDDGFWEGLDLCWNALDNVAARKYTDGRCLWYSKPLLESGTTGTKSNSDVILPFRTSSYNDGEDPPEVGIAMCTLRSFPYLPLHCIEFAKQKLFAEHYEFAPTQFEIFRKSAPDFFEQLGEMSTDGERLTALRSVSKIIELQQAGALDFNACIRAAFERLVDDFRSSILDVIAQGDGLATPEKPFWTGTKRRPNPVEWSGDCGAASGAAALPMEYLYAASNLFAHVYGIEPMRNRKAFEAAVAAAGLEQPVHEARDRPAEAEEGAGADEEKEEAVDEEELERLQGALYGVDGSTLKPVFPHDFEKDDDDNFHIDFLTIATNMRAWNYNIKQTPRHAVKVTAGRIIPALATTTAMVCGLVDIEFCKLVMGLENLGVDKFLCSNINLATGSNAFNLFAPTAPVPIKTSVGSVGSFTSWDKIEMRGVSSVGELVQALEARYGIVVEALYDPAVPIDKAPNGIFTRTDLEKLGWEIRLTDDGKLDCPDACFAAWPQLRMAKTMLDRLPAGNGQRKMFEAQVQTAVASLAKTKGLCQANIDGPVLDAFVSAYRPLVAEDEEKAKRFDHIAATRDYITLQGSYSKPGAGEEDEGDLCSLLPPIKLVVR